MDVVIIGASARAAAFSAHRAGMRPWCVDLFGDADLAHAFPVRRIPLADYPAALVDALADAPAGPVLYTGGLENYPNLLERIRRPLWGNPADVVRRVRSPFLLAEAFRQHGLPTPAVRSDAPPAEDARRWLVKPFRSGGGLGIRHDTGQACDPRTHYFQEVCRGTCFGTVFLGLPDGSARVLGTTCMIAPPWSNAATFHYAGSIGPLPMPVEPLQRIGNAVARDFAVRGLFGVDWARRLDVRTGDAAILPLEVNPRYTASVELLERAFGVALLDLHRAVFEGRPVAWPLAPQPRRICGKVILYARRALVFHQDGPWSDTLRRPPGDPDVEYADVPHAGERLAQGQPVLSIFSDGRSFRECLRGLRERARALDRWLWRQ